MALVVCRYACGAIVNADVRKQEHIYRQLKMVEYWEPCLNKWEL
ncbi:hypothetical protein HMPREF3193_00871 [Bifidobacterium breve]|nr:hypothetical protein HMPREF3193_00871 [Bifidobacterium breve]